MKRILRAQGWVALSKEEVRAEAHEHFKSASTQMVAAPPAATDRSGSPAPQAPMTPLATVAPKTASPPSAPAPFQPRGGPVGGTAARDRGLPSADQFAQLLRTGRVAPEGRPRHDRSCQGCEGGHLRGERWMALGTRVGVDGGSGGASRLCAQPSRWPTPTHLVLRVKA